MIVVLKTKVFSQGPKKRNDKTYTYDEGLKKAKENLSGEKKRETKQPKTEKKQDNTPKQNPKKNQDIQDKIDRTDKEIELEEKKRRLEDLKNSGKPDRIDRLKDKVKSIMSDPKFKKGAKIAGLTAIGAGLTAGAIAGGIKIKKNIDRKRSNEKMKRSIMEKDENSEQ